VQLASDKKMNYINYFPTIGGNKRIINQFDPWEYNCQLQNGPSLFLQVYMVF
jgi:hypothetical protein